MGKDVKVFLRHAMSFAEAGGGNPGGVMVQAEDASHYQTRLQPGLYRPKENTRTRKPVGITTRCRELHVRGVSTGVELNSRQVMRIRLTTNGHPIS